MKLFVYRILVTMCDLIIDLQGSEMLPTLLRATGFGLGSTLAAFLQILAPYVIFMVSHPEGYQAWVIFGYCSSVCETCIGIGQD